MTEQVIHTAGTALGEDAARFTLGEETKTAQVFKQIAQYAQDTPTETMLHGAAKEVTKVFIVGNAAKIPGMVAEAAPKAYNIATNGVRTGARLVAADSLPGNTGASAETVFGNEVERSWLFPPQHGRPDTVGQPIIPAFDRDVGAQGEAAAAYAQGNGVSAAENELLFSKQAKLDFLPTGYLDGEPYPKDKLFQLVSYLEKRDVNVIGTHGNPGFRSINIHTGKSEIHLPENPTVLQVKHELSHWLDCKRLGIEEYNKLSTLQKEQMVLDRLRNKEEFWKQLSMKEQEFSVKYVDRLANELKIKNANEFVPR